MKTMRVGKKLCAARSYAALMMSCLVLSGGAARAFDTGHHSDLTRSALQDEAFGGKAVEVAQLQNWLVDYYTIQPTGNARKELEKLHFDNLYSTAQIRNYWGHLSRNTRSAIQNAARAKDRLRALTLVGASLHAVQDFYTHSNWVETHPRKPGGSYRTETWFSNPPSDDMLLYTGYYPNENKPDSAHEPHGGYGTGLNHDSYGSKRWDEAYVFAYVASRQWVAAMRSWSDAIDKSFWPSVQTYLVVNIGNQQAHLKRDLNAAYRISEWIGIDGNDGHWKGKGSGSAAEHIAFNVEWADQWDSVFVEEFKNKRSHAPLVAGLIGNDKLRAGELIETPSGSQPAVPIAEYKKRAVIVATTKVEELQVGLTESRIDIGNNPDFFAKISIGGQNFIEAMQLDKASFEPKWTSIYFVTSSSPLTINYELWDEDSGTSGGDDPIDINPVAGRTVLNFKFNPATRLCAGDVEGIYDSSSNTYSSEGATPDADRARVRFYVTSRALVAPAAPVTPPAPNAETPTQPVPAGPPLPPGARPLLQKGAKGDWVKYMQWKLNLAGTLPPLTVDGDFGAGSKKAVKAFQKSRGLKDDGDVGPKTWAALEQATP